MNKLTRIMFLSVDDMATASIEPWSPFDPFTFQQIGGARRGHPDGFYGATARHCNADKLEINVTWSDYE